MTEIHKAYSLKALNTFGLDVRAARFCNIADLPSLAALLDMEEIRELPKLILGEGSNMLFTEHFEGLVIHPDFKGIEMVEDDGEQLLVRVGAAENWDQWVMHATREGWFGLENLSLIPGSVGAAPIQNIGAYGMELKDRFAWVEAWDLQKNQAVKLDRKACSFGYRNSLFKQEGRDRYLITHVTFRLSRTPKLMLDYGQVRQAFTDVGGKTPGDLRNIIIHIRNSKLPDPKRFGNGGSFFKNPKVGRAIYNCIRVEHREIPYFPAEDNMVKIPAAWLIEKAGWKDKRLGEVGTWPTQPLVIVNYGGATGREILEFSEMIREEVDQQFGINLEREVQVI